MNQLLKKLISEIILESNKTQTKRLQSLTNSITSDVMRLVHRKKPRLPTERLTPEDYFSFEPVTQTEEFYEITAGSMPLSMDWDSYKESDLEDTTVYAVVEIDREADVFNVSGGDKHPSGDGRLGFTVTVEIPKLFPVQKYKEIRDQISNSVRHEIEHITQGSVSDQDFLAYGRGEKYYTFLHKPAEVNSSYAKYFLKPEEIPAFVRGEAQNSKNKEDLENNIEVFLDGYVEKELISNMEKSVVYDTWLDWAEKHINRKGF